MTQETIAWSVALFLLAVIDVLLIVIYLLLKERLCRKEAEPRCGCPGDGEPFPEEKPDRMAPISCRTGSLALAFR